ncbi:hypothetical protein ACFWDI_36335 [Streptomyces sp. NPDC060064]|uniref:hypothetical protein n=1 Tax=Streptomyces sp. NPDC060064 TaxID=3347049 RepID=UPI0036BCC605
MYIVYTPAGGEPEHYNARSLLVSEASIVERTIDRKWPAIKEGLSEDDLDAMRGVAWILKKRSNPTLRFGEFDPGIEELATRLDKDEIENYVAEAVAIARMNPDVTGEQIAGALQHLPGVSMDPAHAEAVIKEMTEDPKDEAAPEATEPADAATSPSPALQSGDTTTSDSSGTSSTLAPAPSTP